MATVHSGKIFTLNDEARSNLTSAPRRALGLSSQALRLAEEEQHALGMAASELNIGQSLRHLAEYEPAMDHLSRALEMFSSAGDREGEMSTLDALGSVYHALGHCNSAIEYYSSCLALSRSTGNKIRQLTSLNSLGEIYRDLGNDQEALSHFFMALNLAEEKHHRARRCRVLFNVGVSYRNQDKNEQALEYFEESIRIARELEDSFAEARCLNALGFMHQQQERYEAARSSLLESLKISEVTENRSAAMEALFQLGQLFFKLGDIQSAQDFLERALALSEAIQARMYLFRIHLALSEIFVSRRRYKPALIHYRLFHEIQKGFSKEETDISIHRLQVQSEIEKYQKESEIERLRKVELKGKSEELEASLAKLRLIDTVLKKTATSGDMEELAAAIYKGLRTQMDAEVLSILIYHEGKRELDYRISIKGSVHLPSIKESMSQQNSLGVQCVSKRKEIILQHASQEHGRHPSPLSQPFGFVAESVIYLPLISGKRTAGALTVQSSRINAYQSEHLDLLKALAPVTVLALKIFHLSGRD